MWTFHLLYRKSLSNDDVTLYYNILLHRPEVDSVGNGYSVAITRHDGDV